MDEELIARSGLTAEQLQEAADYNAGRLRYRIAPAWEAFLPEERAAFVAVYQIEVFGEGPSVDGKFGPATEEKADQDRQAWLADPTSSGWGQQWDAWLFWDEGPPVVEDEPAPSPAPAPTPEPSPSPAPPSGGGGGRVVDGPDVPSAPDVPAEPEKKRGSVIGWVFGGIGAVLLVAAAVAPGGGESRAEKKARKQRERKAKRDKKKRGR